MLIDHVGIVVKHLEEGIANWSRLFGYLSATFFRNDSLTVEFADERR